MNKSTVALLTETWFNKGNKKLAHDLKQLSQQHEISLLRKDRTSRGGGVALAFDSTSAEFKKVQLRTLKGCEHEILVAHGRVHGVKKSHLVFVGYIPPSYMSAQNKGFFDVLTDAMSEAWSKFPESWVTLGGDWNNRDLAPVLTLFPDLKMVESGPTRKTATLDILVTSYSDHVSVVSVNHALESIDGKQSDHKILRVESVLPRPRAFNWEIQEFLKTSKEGDAKLVSLI